MLQHACRRPAAAALILAMAWACGGSSTAGHPAPADPGDPTTAERGTAERGTAEGGTANGDAATPAGGAAALEPAARNAPPSQSSPAQPVPGMGMEALERQLDEIPAALAVVIDPSLLLPTDPPDFPASLTAGGDPVEVLRERHPTSGNLLRIALVRSGVRPADDESGAPTVHGPQWRYHDNAALRSIQWFKDGVAHGPSRQWRRIGTLVFEGRFLDGERDGLRREYAKNGTLTSVATYVRGVQQGRQETWFASGQRESVSEFVDGQLEGERKVWSREGIVVLRETYRANLLHGRWSDFHVESGQPREWGRYENGKRVGVWQRGDAAGTVLASVPHVDGRPHGAARVWNAEGALVEEFELVDGHKTGETRTWYEDGTPQSEGRLEKGLRVGRWMYWKSDGSVNDRWSGAYAGDRRTAGLDEDSPQAK